MDHEPESLDNIGMFNVIVGTILADLYLSFPVPKQISGWNVALEVGLIDTVSEEVLCNSETSPADSALRWLIEEGFVRGDRMTLKAGFSNGCVLTLQGLRLLSVPQALNPHESFGEGLVKATKDGVKSTVSDLVKTGLLEGGKLAFQAAVHAVVLSAR